ncbi:hypothetical protein [Paenibacillus sp. FSL R7-0273]|uniref:hypothetical protein n=1 Tax=Paenibacillus sp. FSL R7-0273 TaxID=1536772 RepID=UPI000AB8C023|nr:hypothetical protein [Paenibacillus sp. FSL R7-0273]
MNRKSSYSIFISLLLCLSFILSACAQQKEPDTADSSAAPAAAPIEEMTITVAGPPSPPSLPILRIIESKALGESVSIHFQAWESIDTLTALANDEKVSFLALPLNNAVVMYNKGMGLSLMNINTWSVMGMVTTDPAVQDWADLKGTTLYVPMKSSPVDILHRPF